MEYLADFLWDHQTALNGLLFYVLFPVLYYLSGRLGGDRWLSPPAWFVLLLQAILVPWSAFWIYQSFFHPERLGRNPDPLINDLHDGRKSWWVPALLELVLLGWSLLLIYRKCWDLRARQLFRRARRLRAEGRREASHAAYRKCLRILRDKLGHKIDLAALAQSPSPDAS